jgi:response regulator RpfG family c-di-GMP phosphodiesterase
MNNTQEISRLKESKNANVKGVILVIDDSPDMLHLQKTILEMEDFKVFTAQSGDEALNILSEVKKPDLILLDVQMKEMSGTEFLKKLEEKRPDIAKVVPVVFITGMEQIPEGKVLGFIRKPFDMESFLSSIDHFVELGRTSPLYH